jgi:dTDP-4-dehydrorhamnose reductase
MPDVIINTAAMTNVDACETDKEGALLLNTTSVKNQVMF